MFIFGDTYWFQTKGTELGTSSEIWYPKLTLKTNIILICCLVDYQFEVLPQYQKTTQGSWSTKTLYRNYKDKLNACSSLTLETSNLSHNVKLLELHISICSQGHIAFKTFQKSMDLYPYLSTDTARSPGSLRGVLFGLLKRYWEQNKNG